MKIIKRIFLGLLLIIGLAVALIYFYKDTLIKRVVANYNENYNITVAYDDVDLSLFKKIPNAYININNLSVVNDDVKDTLLVSKKVYLLMNLEDLLKRADEKIKIKELIIEDAKLNLTVIDSAKSTFSIRNLNKNNLVKSTVVTEDKNKSKFVIDIEKYQLVNTDISYVNNDVIFRLNGINHTGKGDFSADKLDLITQTTVKEMTIEVGKINYFNKAKIDLDAVLDIDLKNLKFTFKENNAKINDLSIIFNGFLEINDSNQEYDISFKSPNANFKNVLSLIPSAYSSNFNGVTANGIANVNGYFKGFLSDKSFPKYNIHIKTDNASFKYPDLPKQVENINFNGSIASNSATNNPFLDIKNLKFTIDKDTFETKGKITKLTSNPTFDAQFKGTLNLDNLTQAYPLKIDTKLAGILKADFFTQADKEAIVNNKFDRIKTKGTASLEEFSYTADDLANIIEIANAAIKFNTKSILLTDFNAKTGKSDIKATGKLDNLFAFLFDDKKLKGNFKVNSNNFVVSDFLVDENKTATNLNTNKAKSNTQTEALKIPSFLDISTDFKANRVVYDNLELKQVSGLIKLSNQKATLVNTKAKMLGGNVIFNGDVDTKPKTTVFDMDMNIDKFDIANSFKTLETFKKIVPIAQALKGKYNTTIKLKGTLKDDFLPDLNTLSGNLFTQLFVKEINESSLPLLTELNSQLSFIDFNKIDLSKLKAVLSFSKGQVHVNPFDFKYDGITMRVSGSHGFDKSLAYQVKMDVPAKYLGAEAVNLLSKLTNINKDTISIPLSTMINGSILKPVVKVDYKTAINHLTLKVMEYQKQELANQASSQINDAIGNVLSNTGIDSILGTSKDSTNTNPKDILNEGIKDGVKDVLDNIFGGKKKKKK